MYENKLFKVRRNSKLFNISRISLTKKKKNFEIFKYYE